MKTLRQRINEVFGWKEDPRYEGIENVSEVSIRKDPRVIFRNARESGSLDALQRWFAEFDKQLKEQSERSS